MSVRAAWERLGIEPTADAREVKRAYARLLKEIDADADPAGFIALREAYETALASGGETPSWERDDWDPDVHDDSFWTTDLDEFGDPAGGDEHGLLWGGGTWRPPAPPLPSGTLGEAARTLDRLLFDAAENDPEAIAAAGTALLREIDRASIDEADEVEYWLASAIGGSIPRSDPLVRPAIRRFGWERAAGGPRHNWDVELVLERAEDLRFARSCRNPASAYYRAYRELTGPPREKVTLFQLGLAQDVRELMRLARTTYPTIEREFDPQAHQWWEAYFRGPHLPSAFWLIMLAGPLVLTFAGAVAFEEAVSLALVPVWVLAVLGLILAWSRARARVLERIEERRWRGAQWKRRTALALAGALLLPPLAAAAPGDALSGTLIAAAATILLVLIWRDLPPPLDEDEVTRGDRRICAAVAGLVAILLLFGLPAPASFNLILPMTAVAVAAAAGHETAATLFERLGRGTRAAILAGAAAANLALLHAVVSAMPLLPPPWIAALVPVVIAVQFFATAASRVPTPWIEWPIRVAAIVFHVFASSFYYNGDGARGLAGAACLYGLVYAVVRVAVVSRAALNARPPAWAD